MKTHDPVRFSIVVPAFNEAHYIGRALTSLTNQDYSGRYEIIVVDNNSTDQTIAVARSFGVKVVEEKRAGVCWARHKGTEIAQGEIIVSTDADSVFSPSWLSEIDKKFINNPKYIAVAGPCKYYDGPLWGKLYPYLLFGATSLCSVMTGKLFYITATNIAFKKSAWTAYNTELTQGGDELDLLRNLQKHGRVGFNNRNPIFTSARRLERGLVYNVFVSFFVYYLLAYNLNRLFKKRIIGTAHIFRTDISMQAIRMGQLGAMVLIAGFCAIYTNPGKYVVEHSYNLISLRRFTK